MPWISSPGTVLWSITSSQFRISSFTINWNSNDLSWLRIWSFHKGFLVQGLSFSGLMAAKRREGFQGTCGGWRRSCQFAILGLLYVGITPSHILTLCFHTSTLPSEKRENKHYPKFLICRVHLHSIKNQITLDKQPSAYQLKANASRERGWYAP